MPIVRHVALIIGTSDSYGRGLHHGIAAYLGEHQRWWMLLAETNPSVGPLPGWLPGWRGDGIIARLEIPEISSIVEAAGAAVVNVSGSGLMSELPRVQSDSQLIAQAGLDHLVERGFQSVAFCGWTGFDWSVTRCRHFCRLAKAAHRECVFLMRDPAKDAGDYVRDQEELIRWVSSLSRPVGIMACNDARGRQLLSACAAAGLSIPTEVGVLGVDNDDLLCGLSTPPLSSLALNSWQIGYEAARILDGLMDGAPPPARPLDVPPSGITTRASTDILAVDDAEVAHAIRFMRGKASSPIGVNDVANEIKISRRSLERRFNRLFGRTIYQEITRLRIEKARQLLTETDVPMKGIAQQCGFSRHAQLIAAFQRLIGMSASEYRKRNRPLRNSAEG